MRYNILKATLLFTICLLSMHFTYGQEEQRSVSVSSAVPFLLIAPDARASGFGDLGAASSTDANSMHWNSAKYPYSDERFGIALSYTPWLAGIVDDIGLSYLTGYYKIGDKQAVSASLKWFSLGEIIFTDDKGENPIPVTPNEFQFSAGYSRKFAENFSASLNGSFIYSNLQIQNAIGSDAASAGAAMSGAVDIGLLYNKTWDLVGDKKGTLRAGLNWANIGAKMSYTRGTSDEDKDFLPTTLRIGLGYKLDFDKYNSIEFMSDFTKLLVPAADTVAGYRPPSAISGMFVAFADKPFMNSASIAVGTEYSYRKLFALRAGYYYENADSGGRQYATFGVGLRYSMVAFDFSYLVSIAQRSPLDSTIKFTLSLQFNDESLNKNRR